MGGGNSSLDRRVSFISSVLYRLGLSTSDMVSYVLYLLQLHIFYFLISFYMLVYDLAWCDIGGRNTYLYRSLLYDLRLPKWQKSGLWSKMPVHWVQKYFIPFLCMFNKYRTMIIWDNIRNSCCEKKNTCCNQTSLICVPWCKIIALYSIFLLSLLLQYTW